MIDVSAIDGGSVVLLEPLTDAARKWFNTYIGQDNGYQPYWPVVAVERRYVASILEGLDAARREGISHEAQSWGMDI